MNILARWVASSGHRSTGHSISRENIIGTRRQRETERRAKEGAKEHVPFLVPAPFREGNNRCLRPSLNWGRFILLLFFVLRRSDPCARQRFVSKCCGHVPRATLTFPRLPLQPSRWPGPLSCSCACDRRRTSNSWRRMSEQGLAKIRMCPQRGSPASSPR